MLSYKMWICIVPWGWVKTERRNEHRSGIMDPYEEEAKAWLESIESKFYGSPI